MENIQIFDKFAIFATGGKQYQAVVGKTLAIEKIEGEAGTMLEFTDVLFRKTEEGVYEVGAPFLAIPIKASIVKQMRGPKLIVFKFKRRQKVRVKNGHRQELTVIRFESI